MNSGRIVGFCALVVLVAFYVVGAVSVPPESLELPTLPLWAPIVLGFVGIDLAKWAALPCFLFATIAFVWRFPAAVVSGHFFPTAVAMTLLVPTDIAVPLDSVDG